MISGGRLTGSVCHCFAVYPRKNASYSGRPTSDTAFSSRLAARPASTSADCPAISARASSGDITAPKYSQMVPRLIGSG